MSLRPYLGFCSNKWLGILLLPRGRDASPLQGYPSIKFASTHLYTWVERGTVRVKCLAKEHNTMSPAWAWTWIDQSGVKLTNHEATALQKELKDNYNQQRVVWFCRQDVQKYTYGWKDHWTVIENVMTLATKQPKHLIWHWCPPERAPRWLFNQQRLSAFGGNIALKCGSHGISSQNVSDHNKTY